VWADRESSLSLRGRAYTYIPRTVQPLHVSCLDTRLVVLFYGLDTVIILQRIAPPIPIVRRQDGLIVEKEDVVPKWSFATKFTMDRTQKMTLP
jgi:hypothetical protein